MINDEAKAKAEAKKGDKEIGDWEIGFINLLISLSPAG